MLRELIADKWFRPRAVVGFWPANSVGDDIRLFTDETRTTELATIHGLRQQMAKREGRPNVCVSDFVAPLDSGKLDYLGGFVVTAGAEEEAISERFARQNDDYKSIIVKALADRFAEGFAERLHQRVRKEFWGYAPDEAIADGELLGETYRGIRPAPGYPAQPDHTEKPTLFRLLDAEAATGVKLTENFAMWPGSSVSGLYFAHPESYYFGVAKIERDQVEDYAARKGMTPEEVERWLAPDPQLRPQANRGGLIQSASCPADDEAVLALGPRMADFGRDVARNRRRAPPSARRCASSATAKPASADAAKTLRRKPDGRCGSG